MHRQMTLEEMHPIWLKLADDERSAAEALFTRHFGRASAIHMGELAAEIGVSTRRLQEIVKDLVEVYQLPIGGGLSCGYWWIATAQEMEEAARNYRRRGISNLVHEAALRRIGRRQLMKEVDEELAQLNLWGGAADECQ